MNEWINIHFAWLHTTHIIDIITYDIHNVTYFMYGQEYSYH